MTDNEQFIYESIIAQVRMGFLSVEEIKENIAEEIEDNGFEEEIPENWAWGHIDSEWSKLLADSKHWKHPTDTEKLVNAFDEMCGANIIALHKAGYTTSDGEYEVVEVEKELRSHDIVSDGYCFYHEQDLLRTIGPDSKGLYMAFQKINNEEDTVTIGVGKKVAAILRKFQFDVEWDETAGSKILIPSFKWSLLYNTDARNLLDYSEVVELMTQQV